MKNVILILAVQISYAKISILFFMETSLSPKSAINKTVPKFTILFYPDIMVRIHQ